MKSWRFILAFVIGTTLASGASDELTVDDAAPLQLFNLINCAVAVAPFTPHLAADVLERILTIGSQADYGTNRAVGSLSGTFRVGSSKLSTDNSRDTLLVAAGGRLHALSPSGSQSTTTCFRNGD
jgi:hypothetical protein